MNSDVTVFYELEESNQGKVTFGNKKSRKIIRVNKIGKNPSSSIEHIYLVDVLKFNFLGISQFYDKG